MTSTVVVDLETQRLAQEVGGWSNIDRMGFAAGVLFEHETEHIQQFLEPDVPHLLDCLQSAEQVVGFNLLRFDYTVLKPYGLQVGPELIAKTIDMLQVIERSLGFRLPLASLAEATLGEGKSADGMQSVRWFREGKLDQVLKYCEQDVRVTHRLWVHGRDQGYLCYFDRRGAIQRVDVSW
jgi:DEAD/DEAH box helicase domain-containing protein